MCGRFTQKAPAKLVAEVFQIPEEDLPLFSPRFNVAPSQDILAVKAGKTPALLRWGLVPFWSKDAAHAYKMINARAETLAEKPAFREPLKKRRCLIPATGFYEWKKPEKKPYYFTVKSLPLFAFAGLWDSWTDPKTGEIIESATIITTAANAVLKPIHERMPAILSPADFDRWLDEKDPARASQLLAPFAANQIELFPVSTRVNSPKNDDEQLIAEEKNA